MTDFTVQMRTSYKILRDSKFKGRILMQGMIRIGEFDEIFKEADDNIINGKSFESIEWNDHSETILHIPVFDEEALVKHKSTEIRNLCELLQHFYNDIRFVSNEFVSFDSRFSQDPSKCDEITPNSPSNPHDLVRPHQGISWGTSLPREMSNLFPYFRLQIYFYSLLQQNNVFFLLPSQKTFKYTWPQTPETIWKRYQNSEIARIVEKNGHVWFDLWS